MSDGEKHELGDVYRASRGKNFMGKTEWASVARCSCGLKFRVNTAPSKGGAATIKSLHARHTTG